MITLLLLSKCTTGQLGVAKIVQKKKKLYKCNQELRGRKKKTFFLFFIRCHYFLQTVIAMCVRVVYYTHIILCRIFLHQEREKQSKLLHWSLLLHLPKT